MYSQEISKPENAQEGIMNFVQMIINDIEAGNTREALLKAVDLKHDLDCGIYKVVIDTVSEPHLVDTSGINQR